jgi:nicotinate dehydrogenase subunit B
MRSVSLDAAPRVCDWLDLSRDGTVVVRTGRVEIGQGILTALVQLASAALAVDPGRIEIVSGRTQETPDEGYTAGSTSVARSGVAIEAACATCLAHFRAHLSQRLGIGAEAIRFVDGAVQGPSVPPGTTIWTLARAVGLDVPVDDEAGTPGAPAQPSVHRIDLPAKLSGGAFIQDIRTEGMLHGQVLRPPRLGASPELDGLHAAERDGLVVDGGFVAMVDPDPPALARRHARLASRLRWTGGQAVSAGGLAPENLRDLPGETVTTGEDVAPDPSDTTVTATYRRPYLLHGSIGCVTALARWNDEGRLEVISQTQGPYPLRRALAGLFGLDPASVTVTHAQGAGCYGHNGADDVAAEAALIARHHPGRTVRVSWTRADELSAAPLAPAGEVAITARLGSDGYPRHLCLDVVSSPHVRRPGSGQAGALLAELYRDRLDALPLPAEAPESVGWGALRNAQPAYAVPWLATLRLVNPPGLRTSAMRGLGAHLNVFAIESFIDELALRIAADPLHYRLAMLPDPRARAVLTRVADAAGWSRRPAGGAGHGLGLAYARYKNTEAHAAIVAEVEVDERVIVKNVWCCVDAGRVAHADGLRNQVEGGIIQSASWALFEEVRLTADGTLPREWCDYPIMRFPDVPQINVDVVASPGLEPLGAGEVAAGPATAAIANAVAHALRTRLRQLPFTRERLLAAL